MEQALAYQFSKDELEEGDKEPLMSDKNGLSVILHGC